MITALIFILILSALVFVHELGHFTIAKRNGVKVEEFGMGLPPRVWGKQVGETLYSINLLPIGGFVRLLGEDDDDPALLKNSRSLSAKSPWVRAKVLTAGVVANALLGVFLLTILFRIGVPMFVEYPAVQEVLAGSVAEKVGIMVGDQIVKIDGEVIKHTDQISKLIAERPGKVISIEIKRGEDILVIDAKPQDGRLGIVVTNFVMESFPWHKATVRGLEASVSVTKSLLIGLRDFVVTLVVEKSVPEEVAGPLGIAQMTSQARQLGGRFLLQFMGILSLNLALINILPFPALDGGRLFFVIIEGLTGKRLDRKYERWLHATGMALLLLLILVITLQDIRRF